MPVRAFGFRVQHDVLDGQSSGTHPLHMEKAEEYEAWRAGCAFALVFAFVPLTLTLIVLRGRLAGEDWFFALLYGLLYAMPFGYLGLEGRRQVLPWAAALLLTAAVWLAFFLAHQRGEGVNFLVGALTFVAPFCVTALVWALVRFGR